MFRHEEPPLQRQRYREYVYNFYPITEPHVLKENLHSYYHDSLKPYIIRK
jgi:hypothetical protein